MVIGIVISDILLLLYLVINPILSFVSGEITYNEFFGMMISDSDSSMYLMMQWMIFRMILMIYLGVSDERVLIRGGLMQ